MLCTEDTRARQRLSSVKRIVQGLWPSLASLHTQRLPSVCLWFGLGYTTQHPPLLHTSQSEVGLWNNRSSTRHPPLKLTFPNVNSIRGEDTFWVKLQESSGARPAPRVNLRVYNVAPPGQKQGRSTEEVWKTDGGSGIDLI